eukprot:COSAG06_NODE_8934_length_2028_cov_3.613790_3_plen_160_part_00
MVQKALPHLQDLGEAAQHLCRKRRPRLRCEFSLRLSRTHLGKMIGFQALQSRVCSFSRTRAVLNVGLERLLVLQKRAVSTFPICLSQACLGNYADFSTTYQNASQNRRFPHQALDLLLLAQPPSHHHNTIRAVELRAAPDLVRDLCETPITVVYISSFP